MSTTTTMTDTTPPPRSLYERLGKSDGIRAIVHDIVEAHYVNPVIKARFLPYRSDPERIAVIEAHLCAMLEEGGGGPSKYAGRSMPEAHRGMNISEAEYLAAVDDIMMVLRKHGIDEATQKDMLGIAYSLKDQIVRQ